MHYYQAIWTVSDSVDFGACLFVLFAREQLSWTGYWLQILQFFEIIVKTAPQVKIEHVVCTI